MIHPITDALPLQNRSITCRATCHDTPVDPDFEIDALGEARHVPATEH